MPQNKLKNYWQKQDTEFRYSIRIYWQINDTITRWDIICVWAMETFGLPGDKYITHPHEDYMDFIFKDERDAIHFSLRWQ